MRQYILSDRPIISCRVDRRSPRLKRIQQEQHEKREVYLRESIPVETLKEMGFYSRETKPKPFGVEVWSRKCTISDPRDKTPRCPDGELKEIPVPTLAACFPYEVALTRFNPMHWEDSDTYYWGFKQKHQGVLLWCVLDLLDRLLDIRQWGDQNQIPVRWRLGNEKCRAKAEKAIARINEGGWNGQAYPVVPAPDGVDFTEYRHEYTSYDYEWQTGKRSNDASREYWKSVFTEVK